MTASKAQSVTKVQNQITLTSIEKNRRTLQNSIAAKGGGGVATTLAKGSGAKHHKQQSVVVHLKAEHISRSLSKKDSFDFNP